MIQPSWPPSELHSHFFLSLFHGVVGVARQLFFARNSFASAPKPAFWFLFPQEVCYPGFVSPKAPQRFSRVAPFVFERSVGMGTRRRFPVRTTRSGARQAESPLSLPYWNTIGLNRSATVTQLSAFLFRHGCQMRVPLRMRVRAHDTHTHTRARREKELEDG